MADAIISETCLFDDLNHIEFTDFDTSLVMSLLDDSQLEGADDEKLRSVIQSLEAEIVNQVSCFDTNSSEGYLEDYQFSDEEQIESCSTSPDICFEGFDVEMMAYVIDHSADEMENVVEFVGVGNYAEICDYGMAMEKEDDHGLWK